MQVWFKNRRAKWRKQKREDEARRRAAENTTSGPAAPVLSNTPDDARESDSNDETEEISVDEVDEDDELLRGRGQHGVGLIASANITTNSTSDVTISSVPEHLKNDQSYTIPHLTDKHLVSVSSSARPNLQSQAKC